MKKDQRAVLAGVQRHGVLGRGGHRQFVKNIPQMTLNPWWHETQDSDSPGFSSFNYIVLCDYHKYQSIVHTCVFLCVNLLVIGHNACRAPGSSNITATRTLKCLLCGTILLTQPILKLASPKYLILFYQFSETNIYNFSFYSSRPASQHAMIKIDKSEPDLSEDQSRMSR